MTETGHDKEVGDNFFAATLLAAVKSIGLNVEPEQVERMYRHYLLMLEANQRFNLTRITAPAEAAVKHYADSLAPLVDPRYADNRTLNVLDVGTGAGFPAVPLSIVRPRWRITAIDGTGKKARFVAEAARVLGLDNLEAVHCRAVELARERPASFDLVLMRAVGSLATGLKEVSRLLRPGAVAICYKTASLDPAEQQEGLAAAISLGLRVQPDQELTLASSDGLLMRKLVRYEK
ncbi:MAG: 16S rRNA (guanine(527)-N(7))-methyltransferase RsmG [Phycisphaerales bacterium]|nr:16S rRNA (guanine(527)-N(7))-methyltransferase RsmG [Phycisphaerales bacterium]